MFARLLCPWDSPDKNTGVGRRFLLQGIFPTQGLNLGLLLYRQILYCLSHQRSPRRWQSQPFVGTLASCNGQEELHVLGQPMGHCLRVAYVLGVGPRCWGVERTVIANAHLSQQPENALILKSRALRDDLE